jgi:CMP-N-acetylneuraminic acid synthetase
LPAAFHRDGSIYVTRRDVLLEGDSLYGQRVVGHLADPRRSVNIDTPADWRRAEELLGAEALLKEKQL